MTKYSICLLAVVLTSSARLKKRKKKPGEGQLQTQVAMSFQPGIFTAQLGTRREVRSECQKQHCDRSPIPNYAQHTQVQKVWSLQRDATKLLSFEQKQQDLSDTLLLHLSNLSSRLSEIWEICGKCAFFSSLQIYQTLKESHVYNEHGNANNTYMFLFTTSLKKTNINDPGQQYK